MSNYKTTWSTNKLVNDSSSFWMSDSWFNDTDPLTGEIVKDNTADLIKLAAYRRAVSNFVNIVTGENIPVKFSNTDSYTDGKTVWIAAKLDDKNFDANVGLALHEGSHIKYSDFDILQELKSMVNEKYGKLDNNYGRKIAPQELSIAVKNIINYIEDRRIDNLVYKSAPGYRGYYKSMYNKYFYSKIIDKALKSSDMRDETWESYEFRLINLHNSNTDINALKNLREIYKLISLGSINRLKNTEEVTDLAFKIMDVILKNVSFKEDEKDDGSQSSSDGDQGDDGDDEMSGDSSEGGSSEGLDFDNPKVGDGGSSESDVDLDSLSDNQKKQLENAIKKQKKFMDGNIQKKKITKKNMRTMESLEESGSTLESVDYKNEYGYSKKLEVIKVKKLTDRIVKERTLPIISYREDNQKEAVDNGIRLGTILGKKLQVRGETRTTKFTRQKNGRIDKRLLSELGYDTRGNVFFSTQVDEYNPAILRISIDSSGSMSGNKLSNAITCVTAICKAASMIENLDVVVDLRSTINSGSGYYSSRGSSYYPLVVVVYDSRVDKFIKVKKHFPRLCSSGTTPEGLCFEAIMNDMVESNRGIDSYFLNFSDGMPMFSNDDVYYNGESALTQTRKAVNKMIGMGIGVLSYFITSNYGDNNNTLRDFKKMYGSDAESIDVENVTQIARTMNKLFLDK